jgi:hypothetical protein
VAYAATCRQLVHSFQHVHAYTVRQLTHSGGGSNESQANRVVWVTTLERLPYLCETLLETADDFKICTES